MSLDEKVDIVGEEFGKRYRGKYVYKGISWGRQNAITQACTVTEPNGRTRINMKLLQAKLLLASLRDSPKIITLSHLLDESDNGLPAGLGSRMMKMADKVNGISVEEEKNLS